MTETLVKQLRNTFGKAGVPFSLTVFDDASQDGTAEAVREAFPAAQVLRGDGQAFWSKGMALAEAEVFESCKCVGNCWVTWINDDVNLDEVSFVSSLNLAAAEPDNIFVGAFKSAKTGLLTYSGVSKSGSHPLSFKPIEPGNRPKAADSLFGNLVFVRTSTAKHIGGIDSLFPHALGDLDYGLRAKKLGHKIFVLPSYQGYCEPNPATTGPLSKRLRVHMSRKGSGNLVAQMRFLCRHYSRVFFPVPILASLLLWLFRQTR